MPAVLLLAESLPVVLLPVALLAPLAWAWLPEGLPEESRQELPASQVLGRLVLLPAESLALAASPELWRVLLEAPWA